MADYFDIGIIVKPQGINGEVRVYPVTDDPSRFALLDEVTVALTNKPQKTYAIERVRNQGTLVMVKFAGINDRTAAESLTGGVLKIPPEKALPLEDDEYYFRDLLGMAVWTENDEELGVIYDVLRTGANDVYAVRGADQKDILIPAIKQCVLSVSVKDKKMLVRLPEGLRD